MQQFSSEIREKAFRLWMQPEKDGSQRSYEAVAEAFGTTKQTILRWSKGNPKWGEDSWEERRNRIHQIAAEKTEQEISDWYAELSDQAAQLRKEIFDEIRNIEVSSKEGGGNLFLSLSKFERDLRGPRQIDQAALAQELLKRWAPRIVLFTIDFVCEEPAIKDSIEARKEALMDFVIAKTNDLLSEELKSLKAK